VKDETDLMLLKLIAFRCSDPEIAQQALAYRFFARAGGGTVG
jgi:hypothetical protein